MSWDDPEHDVVADLNRVARASYDRGLVASELVLNPALEGKLVAMGGICAPFDVPLSAISHCELCALYPPRYSDMWSRRDGTFYVTFERQEGLERLVSRLLRQPTEWHEVHFFKSFRIGDILPSFTASRGGIDFDREAVPIPRKPARARLAIQVRRYRERLGMWILPGDDW